MTAATLLENLNTTLTQATSALTLAHDIQSTLTPTPVAPTPLPETPWRRFRKF